MENVMHRFVIKGTLIENDTGKYHYLKRKIVKGNFAGHAIAIYMRQLKEEGKYHLSDEYSIFQLEDQVLN